MGNGRSSDVEAEVLRARRARGAARDPGALVRREDLVRGADLLELGEPLVLGDLGLAVEGGVARLLRLLKLCASDARIRFRPDLGLLVVINCGSRDRRMSPATATIMILSSD